ncbi:MAG: hypothetical protein WC621_00755 [Patescibacteria group bacterium]
MNNYSLKPLSIVKIVVVILIMAAGVILAVKNGGATQAEKYTMLNGGAIIIAIGTVFCIIKPELLYFFGIIFFSIGSFGVTTYALTGPEDYMLITLPNNQIMLVSLIPMQLVLVGAIMMLVIMRIGKHFLYDDRMLTEEFC